MFLSADEIKVAVEAGQLGIRPFFPELLKPASYVLRLDNEFLEWKRRRGSVRIMSAAASEGWVRSRRRRDVLISRGAFFLGRTLESLAMPHDLVGLISNLSHLSRFGLSVNGGSFWINPGFGSAQPTKLTLELSAVNPNALRLVAGMPVCHVAFTRVSPGRRLPLSLRRSIYEGRDTPAAPMLFEEFNEVLGKIRDPN